MTNFVDEETALSLALAISAAEVEYIDNDYNNKIKPKQNSNSSNKPVVISLEDQWKEMCEICRISQTSFIDPSFGPSRGETWNRVYSTWKSYKLFGQSPAPEQIRQGELGDCWLLSALSVLTEHPNILKNLIPRHDLKIGVFEVHLWPAGEEKILYIDDRFPHRPNSSTLKYAQIVNEHLWVAVLEKAVAKLFGSYSSLKTGTTLEGLSILTGMPCETIHLEKSQKQQQQQQQQQQDNDKDILWAQLLSFRQSGYLMGASCAAHDQDRSAHELMGLLPNHAYAILEIVNIQSHRLIKLRNPWGKCEWKGDWSDDSPLWTPLLKDKLKISSRDDGIFWMSFNDFVDYFVQIDVCKYKNDWIRVSSNGEFISSDSQGTLSTFQITPFKSGHYLISVTQPNARGKVSDQEEVHSSYSDMGLCILQANGMKPIGYVPRQSVREISIEVFLEEESYIVVPFSFQYLKKKETSKNFVITVFSIFPTLISNISRSIQFLPFALLSCARKYWKSTILFASVKVFSTFDRAGIMMICENSNPLIPSTVEFDLTGCMNMLSSRRNNQNEGLKICDTIPSNSFQFIVATIPVVFGTFSMSWRAMANPLLPFAKITQFPNVIGERSIHKPISSNIVP